jgi:hypothetical protein
LFLRNPQLAFPTFEEVWLFGGRRRREESQALSRLGRDEETFTAALLTETMPIPIARLLVTVEGLVCVEIV